MKKIYRYSVILICTLLACLFITACNSKSNEDYDKLSNEYANLLEEKNNFEKISDWLELYNSIKLDKSFNEISALFDFEYATVSYGIDFNEDGSQYTMNAYAWKNNELFDVYHKDENQILVVFLDNVAIYKQYGNQVLVFDNGTVRFPAPKG